MAVLKGHGARIHATVKRLQRRQMIEKEMNRALPRSRQAAMLCLMRSYLRNPVGLPLPEKFYRCKHETLHPLQACRFAQAGGR